MNENVDSTLTENTEITLSESQFSDLLSEIRSAGSSHPKSVQLDPDQLEQIISGLTPDNSSAEASAATELEAIQQTNSLLSYNLLVCAMLFGIIVILFFRRK